MLSKLDGLDLSIQIQLHQVEYLLLNTAVTVDACTTPRMIPEEHKNLADMHDARCAETDASQTANVSSFTV